MRNSLPDTLTPHAAVRRDPPLVPGHWLWGSLPDIQRAGLGFYMRAALDYGDILRFRIGPYTSYMINHPDYIKHVLQEHHRGYDKQTFATAWLKPVVGEGLLTSEGEHWRSQRRLMQPAFHRLRIAALAATMADCTAAMLDRWRAVAATGQPIDVAEEMMRLTLDIVSKSLFSHDIRDDAAILGQAVTAFVEHFGWRTGRLFSAPAWVPTARNRRLQQALRAMDAVIYRIIRERRARPAEGYDLFSLLLDARDEETGAGMSDQQLHDEVITLYTAGHETTAIALAWTWYLLSTHPTVEQRLHAELASVLGGRTPTIDDLPNLPYTRMVIEESMRLYPPVWAIGRRPVQEDEVGGYRIPANTFLFICPYVLHRHPAFWENPEGFNPERFAPGWDMQRPRYAYVPFGGGPRQCIGNSFALTEAQIILAMTAQTYRLSLVPGHPVEPAPLLTLRPRYGMVMSIQAAEGETG